MNLLFLGIQTLGEELSYLLQFTKGPNRRPSAFRRIVFFIFHFLFPFFVEKELYLIEDSLNNLSANTFFGSNFIRSCESREAVKKIFSWIRLDIYILKFLFIGCHIYSKKRGFL